MKLLKYPLIASLISLASIHAVHAQTLNGGLAVDDAPVASSYTSTSLTLDVVNYIFDSTGDFATTAPAFSTLTADGSTISGLSTTATAENIPNFFLFAGAGGAFSGTGSTPNNRFSLTLTSLTDNGGGTFNGLGTIYDSATTGAFAPTPASFTIGFSSLNPGNYSFTLDTLTPTPEPATLSLVTIGAVGAWALRRRKN